jgi:hypothetical protein
MVLVVVSPKRAGVVPEVVLRNALRTGSEVVSENDPPVVFGVVKAIIGIGWIEEAAARFYF